MNDVPSIEEISQFVLDAGHGEITPMLAFVEKYPDHLNSRDRVGDTALTWAIIQEEPAVVSYLLSNRASVDAPGKHGRTPIFYTIIQRNNALTEKLIELGADINHADDDGNTPLMQAALCDIADAAVLLLAKGADPMRKNAKQKTAAQIALDAGNPSVAALIEQACIPYYRVAQEMRAGEVAVHNIEQLKSRIRKQSPFNRRKP